MQLIRKMFVNSRLSLLGHCGLIAYRVELVHASWPPIKEEGKSTSGEWVIKPSPQILTSRKKHHHQTVEVQCSQSLIHNPFHQLSETVKLHPELSLDIQEVFKNCSWSQTQTHKHITPTHMHTPHTHTHTHTHTHNHNTHSHTHAHNCMHTHNKHTTDESDVSITGLLTRDHSLETIFS